MKIKLFPKNKKGNPLLIVGAIFAGLLAIPFLFSGGFSASWTFGKFLSDVLGFMREIPTVVWIIIGVLVLFKWIGGKKK